MVADVAARVLVLALDVRLELAALDPPLPATADANRRQVAAPDERIGLVDRDVEDLGDVGDAEEPWGGVHRLLPALDRPGPGPELPRVGRVWHGRAGADLRRPQPARRRL